MVKLTQQRNTNHLQMKSLIETLQEMEGSDLPFTTQWQIQVTCCSTYTREEGRGLINLRSLVVLLGWFSLGACSPGNFANLCSLKCHFRRFDSLLRRGSFSGRDKKNPAHFCFDSLQALSAYFSPLPISQPVRNTKEASAEERGHFDIISFLSYSIRSLFFSQTFLVLFFTAVTLGSQESTKDRLAIFSLFNSEFHDKSGESDKNQESGRQCIKSGGWNLWAILA